MGNDEQRDLADVYRLADSGRLSKSYSYLWNNFAQWCSETNQPALPAEPEVVAAYLRKRSDNGSRHSTLRVIAAAIARRHLDEGLGNPCEDVKVRQTLERYLGLEEEPGRARVLPLDMSCYLTIRETAYQPRATRGGRLEDEGTARMRGAFDVAMIGLMRDARLMVREATELNWPNIWQGEGGLWHVSVPNLYRPGERESRVISKDTKDLLDEMRSYTGWGERILGLSPNQVGLRIRDAAMQAGLGEGYSGESPRMGMLRDLETLGVELLGNYAAR